MKTRVVPLHTVTGIKTEEKEKISLARCREILNRNGLNYTDEEVIKIREFLYQLVEIAWAEEAQQAMLISLEQHKATGYEKSNYLRTG